MTSPQFLYGSQEPVRISRRPQSSSANEENVENKLIQNGVSLVEILPIF